MYSHVWRVFDGNGKQKLSLDGNGILDYDVGDGTGAFYHKPM